jgi:hypothetical protein
MAENICGSICRELLCELEANHRGKHRCGGVTWTDAGAARIAKEDVEAKTK